MSSSISSIGGNSAMMMQGMRGLKHPDPTQMAENLFSKLDTTGQGYITKSELQTALDKVSSSSSSSSSTTSSVDDMFSQLDTDSDGKVTKQEFSDTLKKVAEQLDNQAMSMNGGMQGGDMNGMGGMPPPPPPQDSDTGLTKDQLTSAAKEASSSDSTTSSSLTNLANNFDTADTNGDGKVSFMEAMVYELKTSSSDSSSSSTSTDAISSASGSDLNAKVMSQIMKLMQAYGVGNDQNNNSLLSTLSVTA
jgi:Ca2+-binding EF-hand superfamily protein